MRKCKKIIGITVAVWVFICTVFSQPAAYAWGDNCGGRESHTIDEINSGVLGDSIIFNTISDSVFGDEKNFVAARENTGINAGQKNVWNANEIDVEDGKEYLIRLYVHNNSPLGLDAVSENTRVAFSIPAESGKQIEVNGFIFSDNATPSEYWDYVNFNSDHTFHLEYACGSAIIENNGFASQANGGAKPLSDEIVTAAASKHGVAIGYDALDGKIPGCYQYDCYISIRVKAVYDNSNQFSLLTGVRRSGVEKWQDTVKAKAGDQLEFLINYTNVSNEPQEQVVLQNVFPGSLSFLDGSIVLPGADSIQIDPDTLTGEDICIGDFAAGESASIQFRAEVPDSDFVKAGGTSVNWVSLRVGSSSKYQHMSIEFPNTKLNTALIVLTILVVICLIGAAISGLYLWRNREVNKGHGRRSNKK